MGRAAEMLGTTQGFLRAIGEAGLITPLRSEGGHRRYSRYQALRPLRETGVLIVGSGMSYHNPNQADSRASAEFGQWLDGALAGDAGYRRSRLARWAQAPSGRTSHPTQEHLMPLMVCSAAGSDAPGRKLWAGSLGGTSVSAWAFD
jgi:aromatic ring-opening dioxygenase catalytic subunit (LigB family)